MASTQTPALHSPLTPTTAAPGSSGASDVPATDAPHLRAGAEGVVAAAEGEGVRRLLLFAAGGRIYGSDIAVIREIVPFRRCTRLPGAPPYVCGLINLRGTLVTVVDLAARLAGDADGATAASRASGSVVLVEYGAKVVGLAVDQVRDVQAVAEAELEPVSLSPSVDATASGAGASTTGDAAARGGVAVYHGSGQLGGEVVVVLDVHTILRQVLA